MDTRRMEILNREYEPLRSHTHKMLKALTAAGLEYEWGYFAQHTVRNGEEWFFEHYPIPVITVRGMGEIGFDLNQTFVEFKMDRVKALSFDFTQLKGFAFEVYGIQEYLNDFYNARQSIQEIHDKIRGSDEEEVGVSLLFGYLEPVENILTAIGTMQQLLAKRQQTS